MVMSSRQQGNRHKRRALSLWLRSAGNVDAASTFPSPVPNHGIPVLLNGPDAVNNLGMASSGKGSENARIPDMVKAP